MEKGGNSNVFVGIDIGGTLAKLCVYEPVPSEYYPPNLENLTIKTKNGRIYFNKFKVNDMQSFFKVLHDLKEKTKFKRLYVTGGGAFKYAEELHQIDSKFIKVDEMGSLLKGFNFLDQHVPDYSFFYRDIGGPVYTNQRSEYPYLLVNIGSGVSILKFSGENKFERVGGTSMGGGTFLGICNLLLGTNDFDEILALAMKGKSENADVLIKDIYRAPESPLNAKNTKITYDMQSEGLAVSLGKLSIQHMKKISEIKKEDIARSLLKMVAFNISQIAYYHGKIHEVKMIYFAGNFIRNHTVTMECISYALDYFSTFDGHPINAIFLKHDGFLGALGCVLEATKEENSQVLSE